MALLESPFEVVSFAIPQRVIDAVFTKAEVGHPDSCWPWTRSVGSHGYGQVGWSRGGGKAVVTTAQRVAWTHVFGPVPDGGSISQTCANRRCVNPGHLECLEPHESARNNGQWRKTHCPSGHPYSDANLIVLPDRSRRCRICTVNHRQELARRRRALEEFHSWYERAFVGGDV